MTSPRHVVRELKKAHAGERFQRLHKKRRESKSGLKSWHFSVGGALVVGIGVATYPVPFIPSELTILIGFALLAQGSLRGARFLDALELRVRKHGGWLFEFWRPLPRAMKLAVSVATSTALGGVSYLLFRALME